MGEGIQEATLVKWLKSIGDKVEEGEALLEVSTDKVDTEISSPGSGYLVGRFAEAGEIVAINSVIAYLAPNKEMSFPPPAKTSKSSETGIKKPHQNEQADPGQKYFEESLSSKSLATPLAKRIGQLTGVRVSALKGTGAMGRVTRRDVLDFIEKRDEVFGDHNDLGDRLETQLVHGKEFLDGVEVRREKMSPIRRITAEHMIKSVRTSPHVTTIVEVDLEKLVADRQSKKAEFEREHGSSLTLTHYLLAATVAAIKKHPVVNCSVDQDCLLWKDDINLGFAVAIPSGLVVPVLKKAQDLSLPQLALAANDLVQRARHKKLQADELRGGTFSLTNPGSFGSILSMPIINQPQVAILSIGQIVRKPVVIGEKDEVVIRPMMYIGLTFDHRVIDGEGGAKFLATLKGFIETLDYI